MIQKIADLLPEGRENAVPAQELARLAGFSSVRDLQRAIALERDTTVILSTCGLGGGYFRPASQDEIRAFVRTLEARSRNTNRALRSARAALKMEKKNPPQVIAAPRAEDWQTANQRHGDYITRNEVLQDGAEAVTANYR